MSVSARSATNDSRTTYRNLLDRDVPPCLWSLTLGAVAHKHGCARLTMEDKRIGETRPSVPCEKRVSVKHASNTPPREVSFCASTPRLATCHIVRSPCTPKLRASISHRSSVRIRSRTLLKPSGVLLVERYPREVINPPSRLMPHN